MIANNTKCYKSQNANILRLPTGHTPMRLLKYCLIVASLVISAVTTHAQEREWVLDAATDDVFLAFGVPNTADVAVSLWCTIGSGQPKLFAAVPTNQKMTKKPTAQIQIETKSFDLPVNLVEGEKPTIETRSVVPFEILTAMENQDRFTLVINDHKSVFPLEGADVPNFIKLCEAKP
jgi:hypothetical protein